jgi:hypothetical protein
MNYSILLVDLRTNKMIVGRYFPPRIGDSLGCFEKINKAYPILKNI